MTGNEPISAGNMKAVSSNISDAVMKAASAQSFMPTDFFFITKSRTPDAGGGSYFSLNGNSTLNCNAAGVYRVRITSTKTVNTSSAATSPKRVMFGKLGVPVFGINTYVGESRIEVCVKLAKGELVETDCDDTYFEIQKIG